MTDEQIIREAIGQVTIQGPLRTHIEAFERILSRTLPQLPHGWRTKNLQFGSADNLADRQWHLSITDGISLLFGHSKTPRAAYEAAIAKVATPTGKDSL